MCGAAGPPNAESDRPPPLPPKTLPKAPPSVRLGAAWGQTTQTSPSGSSGPPTIFRNTFARERIARTGEEPGTIWMNAETPVPPPRNAQPARQQSAAESVTTTLPIGPSGPSGLSGHPPVTVAKRVVLQPPEKEDFKFSLQGVTQELWDAKDEETVANELGGRLSEWDPSTHGSDRSFCEISLDSDSRSADGTISTTKTSIFSLLFQFSHSEFTYK